MSSWGTDARVDMVVASAIHHGSLHHSREVQSLRGQGMSLGRVCVVLSLIRRRLTWSWMAIGRWFLPSQDASKNGCMYVGVSCLCICMYACKCVGMHACLCVHTFIHTCANMSIFVYMCVCICT